MWKVTLLVPGAEEPTSVVTANPDSEVQRFLFKDANAHIKVEFDGSLRREYKDGKIQQDILEFPKPVKLMEDGADALAFMAYVGERRDYIDEVKGTTKKQRDRLLRRRLEKFQKEQAA